jgi:hypothetical protein
MQETISRVFCSEPLFRPFTTMQKMENNDANQSFKNLVKLTLRYDKNQIIHPNPDKANKSKEEFFFEKVPQLVHILINGKPKERVHVAFGLKNLSEDKRFRIPLCMSADFIEAVCSLFYIEENTDVTRRCQFHGLAILNNLLLEVGEVNVLNNL